MDKVFISCKESRIESNRCFYGCFYLGSFDYGLSLTVANALRRTLLSDCPGLGIISVTIENVTHEYSTLPGVRESVLDILLNLKEIVFKKTVYRYGNKKKNPWHIYKDKLSVYESIGGSYFRPVVGYLKMKGPGVIRAKDLKLPPFIQCVDPEQYIATLADDGSLCMKFVIMEGKSYYNQKQNVFLDKTLIHNRQNFFKQVSLFQESEEQKKQPLLSPTLPYSPLLPTGEGGEALSKNKLQNENVKENLYICDTEKESTLSNFTKKDAGFVSKSANSALAPEGRERGSSRSRSRSLRERERERRGTTKSKKFEQEQGGNPEKKQNLFLNSLPLNMDTVFNPVIKVNYIIEESSNKLVLDSNKKSVFVDEISSLIESSMFLKENVPFLTKTLNDKKLTDLVNTYSMAELQNLNNTLHPLKKETSQSHTIILEIWTNGSIHPNEALKTGLNNLSSAFLNLGKSHIYSSLY